MVAPVVTALLLLLNTGCAHFNPSADSHASFLMRICNRKLALILPDFYPAGEEEVVVVVTLWLVSCWVGLYLVPLDTSLLPRYVVALPILLMFTPGQHAGMGCTGCKYLHTYTVLSEGQSISRKKKAQDMSRTCVWPFCADH